MDIPEGGADAASCCGVGVRRAPCWDRQPGHTRGLLMAREPASLTLGLFFLSAATCHARDLSSLSRDPARTPCGGSEGSQLLGRQGSPSLIPKLSNLIISSVFKKKKINKVINPEEIYFLQSHTAQVILFPASLLPQPGHLLTCQLFGKYLLYGGPLCWQMWEQKAEQDTVPPPQSETNWESPS